MGRDVDLGDDLYATGGRIVLKVAELGLGVGTVAGGEAGEGVALKAECSLGLLPAGIVEAGNPLSLRWM